MGAGAPSAGGGASVRRLLATVFAPFAVAYLLSFLLRNVNAVAYPELVREFALDPGALGLLTSTYFLAFAGFQLPLGMLLDRYGPRRVDAVLLVVAAAGIAGFAAASGPGSLVAARALMGLGFCACLMSSLTAIALWFPAERASTLNGAVLAVGACGALLATEPVQFALGLAGWRALFAALAVAVFASAAWIWFGVPERRVAASGKGLRVQARELAGIFAAFDFWRIGLAASIVQGFALAILGLWLGPWLRDAAGLERAEVARQLLYAAAGWGAGAFALGMLCDALAARGVSRLATYKAGCTLTAACLAAIALSEPRATVALWPAYCALSASGTLSFSVLTGAFPREMAARALTALNLLTMGCAFVTQWGVGAIVARWDSVAERYPPEAYRTAIGVLAVVLAASIAWTWLTNRTSGRPPAGPPPASSGGPGAR